MGGGVFVQDNPTPSNIRLQRMFLCYFYPVLKKIKKNKSGTTFLTKLFVAAVRTCCHGDFLFLTSRDARCTFWLRRTRPWLPVGCEHLEGFLLNPSDVHSSNQTVCLCAARENMTSALLLMLVPVSPYSPLSPTHLTMTQSLLFFHPLFSPWAVSLSHNGHSLWTHTILVLLSGGVQGTPAHAPRPERGSSGRTAAQRQGKNCSRADTADPRKDSSTSKINWYYSSCKSKETKQFSYCLHVFTS